MEDQFSRTSLLFGKEKMKRLAQARVAVFGLGGVGGYVVEVLARSGIGTLDLIDHDRISVSNLNRQILATWPDVGRYKADVARERVLSINPNARVNAEKIFYTPQTADQFDFSSYDYIVDAIDTVTGKLMLAEQAHAAGVPIISSMGTGNKMDASAFEVADIYETSICPLARVMRRELKRRGIPSLKVVYSREMPKKVFVDEEKERAAAEAAEGPKWQSIPGSNAFVPASAGLLLAGEVVKDLIKESGKRETENEDHHDRRTDRTAEEPSAGTKPGTAGGESAGKDPGTAGGPAVGTETGGDCGYPSRWCF